MNNTWIKIDERLPDNDGNVLIATRGPKQLNGEVYQLIQMAYYDSKNWKDDLEKLVEDHGWFVSHWMDMPELPKIT